MKKIEVNHTPCFMKATAVAVSFMWIFLVFVFCSAFDYALSLTLSIALLIAIIVMAFFIDEHKTIVEYDNEKIRWKWLWIDYTAKFSNIDSVHYTIIHERTRYGGYTHRFEIIFKLKDSELRLNDRLKSEDIDNCINGNSDNIELMQLYKFIENIYPEKCSGFVKNDTY